MMAVNSLPKTVTRQRRGGDLNPGPTAPGSSTLTTRLPSHLWMYVCMYVILSHNDVQYKAVKTKHYFT